MVSNTDKLTIVSILDDVLGPGSSLKGNEQAHYCPFCHHHKKKLQVNLDTQQWHCWVCNKKGKKLVSLFKAVSAPDHKIQEPAFSPDGTKVAYGRNNNLFTKNIIDPDILIRTGNTQRLSNFMLWQLAYTEIFYLIIHQLR